MFRLFRLVRTEEQPHPETEEGYRGGDGIEKVLREKVKRCAVFCVHVPIWDVILGFGVPVPRNPQWREPVVANLTRRPVRRSPGHKQRKQVNAQCSRDEGGEKGLGVKMWSAKGDITGQLGGSGVEPGRHGRHGRCRLC